MVTLNSFHEFAGEFFFAAKLKQLGQYHSSHGKRMGKAQLCPTGLNHGRAALLRRPNF
jgi:hypothetical protein